MMIHLNGQNIFHQLLDQINIDSTNTVAEPHPLFAEHTYGQNEQDLWFIGSGLVGKFYFVNFHFHWGKNDRHGSEHEIDGEISPAEAHFVFKNNETGQLAVFAFFFTIADHLEIIKKT